MQQKTYRLNQRLAPLHEARAEYRNSRVVLFDVPGHKQRRGTPELTKFLGNECLSVDVNSMKPIDNLSPQPPSSRRPKSSLPTRHSLSSAARRRPVQAMVMSVCKAGDSMIIPRNVHKSAANAMILCGITTIYVDPGIHPELGFSLGMRAKDAETAIKTHPEAKAVFVNNPTYYGICTDIRRIAEAAHAAGMAVLADEAHGTHFSSAKTCRCHLWRPTWA